MASEARAAAAAARREAARERRAARTERWEARFSARDLALAGLLAAPAFLFQPLLGLKLALFLGLGLAAAASGKRVSFPATLLVSAGIVLTNLLVPVGRVLLRLGPLVVTESALLDGIDKALTFEGLMFLSKASVRPGLRLPGGFGAVLGAAFVYYDRILGWRGRIRPASFLKDADELMLAVWEAGGAAPASASASLRSRKGTAILAAAVVLSWLALIAGFLPRSP